MFNNIKFSNFVIIILFSLLANNVSAQWLSTNGPNYSYNVSGNNVINRVNCITINGNIIYVGTHNGVYCKNNADTTWTEINNGLPYRTWITSIAISNNIIYASTSSGLYKSVNYGNSWILVNSLMSNQNLFIDAGIMYAGGYGVFISIDDGLNFYQFSSGIPGSFTTVNSIAKKNNTLYIATSQGLYKSINGGNNWLSVNNITAAINSISIYNDKVIAGTSSGVYISQNNDSLWSYYNSGINSTINLKITPLNDTCLAASSWGNTYLTKNYNAGWLNINSGNSYLYCRAIACDSNNIYIATEISGVLRRRITDFIGIPYTSESIIGDTIVCVGQANITYKAQSIKNATSYMWTLPSGITGISSSDTIIVNVGLSAQSGNIIVRGVNEYGIGDSVFLPISVISTLPDTATGIIGPSTVCLGQNNINYLTSAINGATSYIWTIPTGSTGTSLTNSINVNNIQAGNIIVNGHNVCGNGIGSNFVLNISGNIPDTAGSISGMDTVFNGQNGVIYTVPPIQYATSYLWTLPTGSSGTSNTNSIIVSFDSTAQSGNITVRGNNYCGDGVISNLSIIVKPVAPAGIISGLTSVCQGQENVTYTVPAIQNATSYIWTLPNGVIGTSNTNSITVKFATNVQSGFIKVKGINNDGDGIHSTLSFMVNPLPSIYKTNKWTYFNTSNGLGNNYILSLASDLLGNKWFGTQYGVFKFDSISWTAYYTSNSGLLYDYNYDIYIDSQNNKWFVTSLGISKFNDTNWTIYSNPYWLTWGGIQSFALDLQGNIWIGAFDGVYKYDGTNWVTYTTSDGLSGDVVRSIAIDSQGNKWFGTDQGVSKYDDTNWTTYNTSDGLINKDVFKILFDHNGNIWFGTYSGVSKFDGINWINYNTSNGLAGNYIYRIKEDLEGNIWFSTSSGISKFDGINWTTYNTSNSGLVNNESLDLLIDKNGDKLFCSNGNGVSVLKDSTVILGNKNICQGQNNVKYSVDIPFSNSYIWSLTNGSTGNSNSDSISIDFATNAQSGFLSVKGQNNCGLSDSVSISIIASSVFPNSSGLIVGDSVVCQGEFGVNYSVPSNLNATLYSWKLPDGHIEITPVNSININYNTTIVSGDLIVKGQNACGVGDSSFKTITINPLPFQATVISGLDSVCLGQSNVIYTTPIIINADSYIWTLPSGSIGASSTNSIAVNYGINSQSGNISIKGVNSCGNGNLKSLAIKVNSLPKMKRFMNYNTSNGLNSDFVDCITSDNNGKLWVGHLNGISIFNSSNWTSLSTSDGLLSNAIFDIAIDNQGNKWIAYRYQNLGVSKYDGNSFVNYNTSNGLIDNNVITISIDQSDQKWFGTNSGVSKYDGLNWTNFTISNSGLADNIILDICIDKQGDKWFTHGNNKISRFNDTIWTTYTLPSGLSNNSSVLVDSNNNKWFTTYSNGVVKFDGFNFVVYNQSNSGLISDFIKDIAVDKQNRIWIYTEYGISIFDGVNWINNSSLVGIAPNSKKNIHIDSFNNTWIGTFSSGVFKIVNLKGKKTVCQGESDVLYSIDQINNAVSYNWVLPNGFSGSSNTNSILVDIGSFANSGDIIVYANNICGIGDTMSINVNVNTTPSTPVITQFGNVLQSNLLNGNQWYDLNAGIINGANLHEFIPQQIGSYFVINTLNSCLSDTSNIIYFDNTKIIENELGDRFIKVFPNPFSKTTNISYILKENQNVNLSIYDITGRKVQQLLDENQIIGHHTINFDAKNLRSGIYYYQMKIDNEIINGKIVLNK